VALRFSAAIQAEESSRLQPLRNIKASATVEELRFSAA
jgi:hypothetical protein